MYLSIVMQFKFTAVNRLISQLTYGNYRKKYRTSSWISQKISAFVIGLL